MFILLLSLYPLFPFRLAYYIFRAWTADASLFFAFVAPINHMLHYGFDLALSIISNARSRHNMRTTPRPVILPREYILQKSFVGKSDFSPYPVRS